MRTQPGRSVEDDVFRALADHTRRGLVAILAEGSHSVAELTARFDISQSAISQHLKVLREAQLVTERKVGRNRIYDLQTEPLLTARRWLDDHVEFWASRLDNLGTHLRSKHDN